MNDLDIAAQKIIDKMDKSWQMANLINDSETEYITVFLPVTSLKEWAKRLNALDEIAMIRFDIVA